MLINFQGNYEIQNIGCFATVYFDFQVFSLYCAKFFIYFIKVLYVVTITDLKNRSKVRI